MFSSNLGAHSAKATLFCRDFSPLGARTTVFSMDFGPQGARATMDFVPHRVKEPELCFPAILFLVLLCFQGFGRHGAKTTVFSRELGYHGTKTTVVSKDFGP